MPRKPQISEAIRGQIILLHKQGLSQVKISKTVKCSRCAVQNTISRFERTGSYVNLPKSGRNRVTTTREDRIIERISLRNRQKTAEKIAAELRTQHRVAVSVRTVHRRLAEANLHARKPRRKPLLNEKHRRQRLAWAKKYRDWTVDDWTKVIWSDESNINVSTIYLLLSYVIYKIIHLHSSFIYKKNTIKF